jgi:lysophospholipase L1-like esterase
MAYDHVKIHVVGDSISAGCGENPQASWCKYLDQLLSDRGIPHTITAQAHGGWTCYRLWTDGYTAAVQAADPDIVIVNCGTNDAPSDPAGDDRLGWAWRNMVETAWQNEANVLPVFIQYSATDIQDAAGRSWLVPGEVRANNAIWANWTLYTSTPLFAGIVDLQRVPGNRTYLKGGTDGIHPNDLGNKVYAALMYRGMREHFSWPNDVTQPCGMWGYQPGKTPAAYDLCTGIIPGVS